MMDRLLSNTNHGKQWPSLNGKWIVLVLLVVQEIDLVVTGHCGHPHRHVVVVLSLVAAIVVVIASQSGCSRPGRSRPGPTGRQTNRQTTGTSGKTIFPHVLTVLPTPPQRNEQLSPMSAITNCFKGKRQSWLNSSFHFYSCFGSSRTQTKNQELAFFIS